MGRPSKKEGFFVNDSAAMVLVGVAEAPLALGTGPHNEEELETLFNNIPILL